MVSPEIGVVANDGVIAGIGMGDEPAAAVVDVDMNLGILKERAHHGILRNQLKITRVDLDDVERFDLRMIDRKSTRLNSSHSQISYAVFCLKKKKNDNS